MGFSRRITVLCCVLLTTLLVHGTAMAQCAALLCEMDCRERCRVQIPFGNYVDNSCYNGCLSTEQACKAALPVAKIGCEADVNYRLIVEAAKEAHKVNVVTTMGQCRDINSWVNKFMEQEGGEIARQISNVCGCFVCEQAMAENLAPPPPPAPLSPVTECDNARMRYVAAVNANAPQVVIDAIRQELINIGCYTQR